MIMIVNGKLSDNSKFTLYSYFVQKVPFILPIVVFNLQREPYCTVNKMTTFVIIYLCDSKAN